MAISMGKGYRTVSWILGIFLFLLAVAMLVPFIFSLVSNLADVKSFAYSIAVTVLFAAILLFFGKAQEQQALRNQQSIILVVLIWFGVCVFGALPFYFSAHFPSLVDAVFESTSGFTTTGSTVLPNVELLSHPLHLWRSLSHWLGGMGIVLLGLAVLPALSQGGNALYRAEFSGSVSQRLHPRLMETARALWKIYLGLTIAEFILLMIAGMTPFDALCHAFSTMATGGFSTLNSSIGGFDSAAIEYIVIVFMLLAGISFIQHFRVWNEGDIHKVLGDYELRFYFAIAALSSLIIASTLLINKDIPSESAFRAAVFQTVSILTTTGFVTQDYNLWAPLAQLVLLLLMFVGGCTGSTSGGLKVSRVVLMLGIIRREFKCIAEPQGVFRIRVGNDLVPELVVSALLNLVFLAWLLIIIASLIITATGVELLTAFSAVIACQFNIGPGLAGVGPIENYSQLSDLAKIVLSFCMVAGRLEFYTLMVCFTVSFWRN